jgi:hypothetical protein
MRMKSVFIGVKECVRRNLSLFSWCNDLNPKLAHHVPLYASNVRQHSIKA